MQNARLKIRKMEPVVKVRKIEFEQEAVALAQIQAMKVQKVAEIRRIQQEYIDGIDKVNEHRSQCRTDILNSLEASVDYVKSQWQSCLRELRTLEERERAQIANVVTAKKNLQALEKLSDRYLEEISMFEQRREQLMLDEIALKKNRGESKI